MTGGTSTLTGDDEPATTVLDDGTVIEIKDKMCFAEHVHNKW